MNYQMTVKVMTLMQNSDELLVDSESDDANIEQ